MICIGDLTRIKISRRCNGYYLRWYYNGWHYWLFRTGSIAFITEGEKYRTLGTQKMTIGTGQITEAECDAIRTILNTEEVDIYTNSGWGVVRVDPGNMIVYDHALHKYEAEITISVGSKQVSTTGFSPAKIIPVVVPSVTYCEVIIGTQTWMCKNWDAAYPGSKAYGNNEANRVIYGGLYTFTQVNTPGFVPAGWHVPTEAEWLTLIDFVGDATDAGGKLKEAGYTHWLLAAPPTPGTDDYGFAALGAGYGYPAGNFAALTQRAWFWTATSAYHPWGNYGKLIQLKNEGLDAASFEVNTGMYASLRLVKDVPAGFVDVDGNIYSTVIIGNQEWFVENLRTTKYADGTPIPNPIGADTGESDEWFLPSKDELNAMYTELHLQGVGGFAAGNYWSSSEIIDTTAWMQQFDLGTQVQVIKTDIANIRACRTFIGEAGDYSLRDVGPSGGLIFAIIDPPEGITYFEAASHDQSTSQAWSNITDTAIGTTGMEMGDGGMNTLDIIGQIGHVNSAALLCHNITSSDVWINDTTGAYCAYNNDVLNIPDYGLLYNHHAVVNVHGLAPTGWRVPSLADWNTMIAFIGADPGSKLKEIGLTHWDSPNVATDEYGFNARGSGDRDGVGGVFSGLKIDFSAWTSDTHALNIWNASTGVSDLGLSNVRHGFSVRCMRDI